MSFGRHFGLCGCLAVLALTSCADLPPAAAPPNQVHIASHLSMDLPRPADLGHDLRLDQLVTARYGEKTFTFEGYVLLTDNRLLLTCVDPLGRVAMTVTWTADRIVAKKEPWLPPELPPENMLADLVLLYWPERAVRQALMESGAQLVATPRSRSVTIGGREIVHTAYQSPDVAKPWSGHVELRNFDFGYTLDIESRELPP